MSTWKDVLFGVLVAAIAGAAVVLLAQLVVPGITAGDWWKGSLIAILLLVCLNWK